MATDKEEVCHVPADVLGPTFTPGQPAAENDGRWRQKMPGRAEELKYLKSAERYWYGEGFGSEKRKNKA